MAALARYLALDDFERAAYRHLPRRVWAYVSGGCETDASLNDNRSAFGEYGFITRAFVATSQRSQAATLFGREWASPFGIAPMGMAALAAYRGDLVLARAAAHARVPFVMSGSSLIRMEDVAAANPDAWFQAYVPGEPERILKLLGRVEAAGYKTLVVTADVPVSGNRENNIRAGFSTPLRPSASLLWDGLTHPAWSLGTFLRTCVRHGMPHFENSQATRGAPILARNVMRDFGARDHLHWEHLALIRKRWTGTLIVKGLMHAADAATAREHGADSIIVSNHGGRQLDGTVAPLRVLPGIVDAVGRDIPVMMDSGIRRGNDVLKALALGAKFVFVGRPFNYAASVAGEPGVRHAIALLREEIHRNMALLGINTLAEMTPDRLMRMNPNGAQT
jgi:L-lactate dehydrogenase (cytochrome)